MRTKNDYDDINKLSSENTVEALLEKERQKNPYALNKTLRSNTRGIFINNPDV